MDDVIIEDIPLTGISGGFGKDGWFTSRLENEKYAPSWRVLGEYTLKEKEVEIGEVEIGGTTCHLCGHGLLYDATSIMSLKKGSRNESHQVYMCGTSILTTWKTGKNIMVRKDLDRHIHAECITHCCS